MAWQVAAPNVAPTIRMIDPMARNGHCEKFIQASRRLGLKMSTSFTSHQNYSWSTLYHCCRYIYDLWQHREDSFMEATMKRIPSDFLLKVKNSQGSPEPLKPAIVASGSEGAIFQTMESSTSTVSTNSLNSIPISCDGTTSPHGGGEPPQLEEEGII